jgi:hypothetical protein
MVGRRRCGGVVWRFWLSRIGILVLAVVLAACGSPSKPAPTGTEVSAIGPGSQQRFVHAQGFGGANAGAGAIRLVSSGEVPAWQATPPAGQTLLDLVLFWKAGHDGPPLNQGLWSYDDQTAGIVQIRITNSPEGAQDVETGPGNYAVKVIRSDPGLVCGTVSGDSGPIRVSGSFTADVVAAFP